MVIDVRILVSLTGSGVSEWIGSGWELVGAGNILCLDLSGDYMG